MAESKKVLSREFAKEFQASDKTMYSFKVKFEGDDRTFQYVSTSKDAPPHFKVGEVAEFTITESKYEKDGNTTIYYKAMPVKPAFTPGGGRSQPKRKIDYLAETLSFSQSYIKDCFISGKIELKNWDTEVDRLMAYYEKKLSEWFKGE